MSTIDEVLQGTASFAVVCGDATEVLKTLPADTFHVCYCDPPYGLSQQNTDDVVACLRAWLAGDVYHHGGTGFLGKDWDAFVPGPDAWKEVYRVLKPGAFCVAFSSTRTVDLLGMAMRLAGGEMREGWAWVFGQGFPKNHDVSKAIDKMNGDTSRALKFVAWMRTTGMKPMKLDDALRDAGVISPKSSYATHLFNDGQPSLPTARVWEVIRPLCGEIPPWVDEMIQRTEAKREVVGTKPSSLEGTVAAEGDTEYIERHRSHQYEITIPTTDAAKQWEGWGTTTKPTYEPLVVTRKPPTSTVAHNALVHGCGVLNIDGARIQHTTVNGGNLADNWHLRELKIAAADSGELFRADTDRVVKPNANGRYPSSLALVHDDGCTVVGTKTVKTGMATFRNTEPGSNIGSYSGGLKRQENGEYGYADENGNEAVEEWSCTPTCAVAELGRQSRESTSAIRQGGEGEFLDPSQDSRRFKRVGGGFKDTGTAARFFYQGKATASDRLAYLTCKDGCSHHATVVLVKDAPDKGSPCAECGSPVDVYQHPTVKPYELAKYHASLLSLPEHVRPIAIVPYCGTGVEARALLDRGFRVVAVDIDPRHCEMTLHRLTDRVEPPQVTSLDALLGI